MEDAEETALEIITTSNQDIIRLLNHCDYVPTNTVHNDNLSHLLDHNYFNNKVPLNKPARPLKRNIKITQLRAVYNCTSCGYRAMKRDIFTKHTCTRTPVKYIACTTCTKSDTKNAPEGYEKCPQCSYFTKNKSSLKVHMRIHSSGTPYKCTECEFCAKDLKELIRHYRITNNLTCNCGYSTHVKTRMVTHMRSHSGEKPFSCGICNFSSADRGGLHKHMKRHENS